VSKCRAQPNCGQEIKKGGQVSDVSDFLDGSGGILSKNVCLLIDRGRNVDVSSDEQRAGFPFSPRFCLSGHRM
jgi:hypothetical protein